MSIRVLLVDDHAMVREAIAVVINATRDLSVVAQASSLASAREALRQHMIHVAVVDVSLPDGNGLSLVRSMRSVSASVGLVVLTMHDDDRTIRAAKEAGASALVLKVASVSEVVHAIRGAVRNPRVFVAEGLEDRLEAMATQKSVHLTAREREVLTHLAAGSSIANVAALLYMSESTVKTHTARLYDKLNAHNRAAAIMAAVRLGLVDPEMVNLPTAL